MAVTIQTAGALKKQFPNDWQVEAGTVGQAIEQLDVKGADELILLVNGQMAHWQTPLSDGDVLRLLPAIGGGTGFSGCHFQQL